MSKPVLVRFNLPAGMHPNQLMTLLRDSLDDFRARRANGDPYKYAAEKAKIDETYWPDQEARYCELVGQVEERFGWTRHFGRDNANMRLVQTYEAADGGSVLDRQAKHNAAVRLLCDDE